MWSKGELIKKQKLTILVIVAVIFALIFLGGSQALSKKRRPPWNPNYDVVFNSVNFEIEGGGPVKMQRGTVTSGPGDIFVLDFGTIFGEFGGKHSGWLDIVIPRRSGRGQFYYSWSQGELDYSLSGLGTFDYDKKEKSFIFSSVEDYSLIEWTPPYPNTMWVGYLEFDIYGTPLDQ